MQIECLHEVIVFWTKSFLFLQEIIIVFSDFVNLCVYLYWTHSGGYAMSIMLAFLCIIGFLSGLDDLFLQDCKPLPFTDACMN